MLDTMKAAPKGVSSTNAPDIKSILGIDKVVSPSIFRWRYLAWIAVVVPAIGLLNPLTLLRICENLAETCVCAYCRTPSGVADGALGRRRKRAGEWQRSAAVKIVGNKSEGWQPPPIERTTSRLQDCLICFPSQAPIMENVGCRFLSLRQPTDVRSGDMGDRSYLKHRGTAPRTRSWAVGAHAGAEQLHRAPCAQCECGRLTVSSADIPSPAPLRRSQNGTSSRTLSRLDH